MSGGRPVAITWLHRATDKAHSVAGQCDSIWQLTSRSSEVGFPRRTISFKLNLNSVVSLQSTLHVHACMKINRKLVRECSRLQARSHGDAMSAEPSTEIPAAFQPPTSSVVNILRSTSWHHLTIPHYRRSTFSRRAFSVGTHYQTISATRRAVSVTSDEC